MRPAPRPPFLARWLLARLLRPGPAREGLLGDLEELYAARAAAGRRFAADLWFLRETLGTALRARKLSGHARAVAAVAARSEPGAVRIVGAGPRLGVAEQLAGVGRELRAAVSRLRRSPGFAAAAVSMLALGIGASAAVLTVVYGVLLKPLPYPEADRLVVIEHELTGFDMPGGRIAKIGGQHAQLAFYLEHSRSFEEIGGFAAFDAALAEPGEPELLRMATATAGFFRALGLPPLLGRLLVDDDPAPDANVRSSSLLSHSLWSRRFGSDPNVVGRIIRSQGFDNDIIGVLPATLGFPPQRVSLWGSLPVQRLHEQPEWMLTLMLGRLAPGVTPEQARDELNRLIPEVPDRFPGAQVRRAVEDGGIRAKVTPLRTWLVGDVERALWLLLAAVGVVLVIACVNVTILILVRTEARRSEMAVRAAVGASTGQLVRHFVADSVALVTIAAAVGTTLAVLAIDALLRFGPPSLPRLESVEAGWRVAAFGGIPALACWAIFAVVPWLASGRLAAGGGLRPGRSTTAGRTQLRARHLLVALQLAMALILLVGAGLIVRSFVALSRVDLGIEHRGVLTFRVVFPFQEIRAAGPGRAGPATAFHEELTERLAALPGVEAVGYGGCVPLSAACTQRGLSLRPQDRAEGGVLPVTLALQVSPGYPEALEVPLLAGRTLEPRDHQQRTSAVVISAEAARQFFPDEDPLGQRLVQDGWLHLTPFTVVGVVGDVLHEDPRKALTPFVYLPVLGDFLPYEPWAVSYVVRASVPPLDLVETIRGEMLSLRGDIPMAHVETMTSVVEQATAQLRFAMWLLAMAAAAAMLLSVLGAYGVMAFVVSLRRGEFGIRMALGADGRQLRRMVLRQGTLTTALGMAAGLAGASVVGPLLRSLLFGIGPADPPTYVVTVIGLAVTALLAVDFPARHASRLDPVEILRTGAR